MDKKNIHLMGVCGVGMSSLAGMLRQKNYTFLHIMEEAIVPDLVYGNIDYKRSFAINLACLY